MAISTYALISLEELNAALIENADSGENDESKIRIINEISFQIEAILGRQIVTRGSLTEYHSPLYDQDEIELNEWPVISVTTVHEDMGWASVALASRYPASTLLTNDTDYIKILPAGDPEYRRIGKLLRLNRCWAIGRRAVRVVYAAGYLTTAAVHIGIKAVTIKACKRIWLAQKSRTDLIASQSDSQGSYTRMLPAVLLDGERRDLAEQGFGRPPFVPITGERDAA